MLCCTNGEPPGRTSQGDPFPTGVGCKGQEQGPPRRGCRSEAGVKPCIGVEGGVRAGWQRQGPLRQEGQGTAGQGTHENADTEPPYERDAAASSDAWTCKWTPLKQTLPASKPYLISAVPYPINSGVGQSVVASDTTSWSNLLPSRAAGRVTFS